MSQENPIQEMPQEKPIQESMAETRKKQHFPNSELLQDVYSGIFLDIYNRLQRGDTTSGLDESQYYHTADRIALLQTAAYIYRTILESEGVTNEDEINKQVGFLNEKLRTLMADKKNVKFADLEKDINDFIVDKIKGFAGTAFGNLFLQSTNNEKKVGDLAKFQNKTTSNLREELGNEFKENIATRVKRRLTYIESTEFSTYTIDYTHIRGLNAEAQTFFKENVDRPLEIAKIRETKRKMKEIAQEAADTAATRVKPYKTLNEVQQGKTSNNVDVQQDKTSPEVETLRQQFLNFINSHIDRMQKSSNTKSLTSIFSYDPTRKIAILVNCKNELSQEGKTWNEKELENLYIGLQGSEQLKEYRGFFGPGQSTMKTILAQPFKAAMQQHEAINKTSTVTNDSTEPTPNNRINSP